MTLIGSEVSSIMSGIRTPSYLSPLAFRRDHTAIVSKGFISGNNSFRTLTEASSFFASLTSSPSSRPSASNPYLLKLGPGIWAERIWLPDFVNLIGAGPNVCQIIGNGPSIDTASTVSIGIDGIRGVHLNPEGYDDV